MRGYGTILPAGWEPPNSGSEPQPEVVQGPLGSPAQALTCLDQKVTLGLPIPLPHPMSLSCDLVGGGSHVCPQCPALITAVSHKGEGLSGSRRQ